MSWVVQRLWSMFWRSFSLNSTVYCTTHRKTQGQGRSNSCDYLRRVYYDNRRIRPQPRCNRTEICLILCNMLTSWLVRYVLVRYVLPDWPAERFVIFHNMLHHLGQDLANNLLDFLKENDIGIADCRVRSYGNASNMSGKLNGMRAKIHPPHCSLLRFRPVLLCVFSQHLPISSRKWSDLLVIQRLSDTRWSAHSDAVSELVKEKPTISSLPNKISGDDFENAKTRSEIQGLAARCRTGVGTVAHDPGTNEYDTQCSTVSRGLN